MPSLADAHCRINQALAEGGGIVVMPDDWADIDAMAEEMEDETCSLKGVFDTHPIMQAVAGEMVRTLRERTADSHLDPLALNEQVGDEQQQYDSRWAPSFDESDPKTMSRYYALVHGSNVLYPLESWEDWESVASSVFSVPGCTAHILHNCYRMLDKGKTLKAETVAVARGEIICVFNICEMCSEALRWISFDSDEYSGPLPWSAEGEKKEFDPWV